MSRLSNILEKRQPIDVLLVQPDQGEFVRKRIFLPGVEIPLNVAYLAAYLDTQGISNEILDMRLYSHPYDVLAQAVKATNPRIVGISAFTSEFDNAVKVSRCVKELKPSCITVVGGYHVSAVPAETLQENPTIDYVAVGEGELTLTEMAKRPLSGDNGFADIDGLYLRNGKEIVKSKPRAVISSLSELPFPARHKLEMSRYLPSPGTGNFLRLPSTGIVTSRGCPYSCNYCSKGVWGTRIRFRSPDNVLAEVEHCIDKYGIRDFRFYDDGLTLPQWDINYFCREVLRRGMDISWNCYSRVNHVNLETLQLMKEAGCYHIKYGIEFGTDKSLRLANKKATLDQARHAVALTKKVGIECKANFMLGLPGENELDCRRTIDFAIELAPDLASFYPFDFFPGSKFFAWHRAGALKEGAVLSREVTERLASYAYRAFYFRPTYVLQRGKRFLRYPVRESRVVFNGLKMMLTFYAKQQWNTLVGATRQ